MNNGAQLHLVVNHVSLFALIIGAGTLAASMKKQSASLRLFATVLFVVAGTFGWIAVETGEWADDTIKALGWGSEAFINEHALAAAWALRACIVVAIVALGMEWAVWTRKSWVRPLQWILLVLALCSSAVFARTAYLGGQIRHAEIRR